LSISFRFCTALMFVWSPASGLSEFSFILLWVCLWQKLRILIDIC
jgi:hypothetical protein